MKSKLLCIRSCLLSLSVFFNVSPSMDYVNTISALATLIQNNPERPTKLHEIKNSLNLETCSSVVNDFIVCNYDYLSNETTWAGKPFDIKQRLKELPSFFPYVQKIIVQAEAKIFFWGDLHGSAHSLMRSLEYLIEIGFLQNDFKIVDTS